MEGQPYSREGFQEVIDKTQELMTEKERLLEQAHQEAKIENKKIEEEKKLQVVELMKSLGEKYSVDYFMRDGGTPTFEHVRNRLLFESGTCFGIHVKGDGLDDKICAACVWECREVYELYGDDAGGYWLNSSSEVRRFFEELMKFPDVTILNGQVGSTVKLAKEYFSQGK
jgi:hypothetical protein